ncbi:AbrB/MazE/SpoVT family DNA-binding domain-containing protein [uncultured Jannaschia sp.]|uniref:AbrB/MazE/SpoVT family DNA-binding domain-containing protein n=1 Tax=uncultured Jannaschia sp. TaxID=293347 RepID=UPI0026037E3E|nr:AbrB/MazE/SpoVT family DNA-binding domain-containing protein [uncultured Jannaschia sp.]
MTDDAMRTFEVPVQENGRMILPLELRRRLGLDRGGRLVIEAGEAGIVLTTAQARRRRAQEIARKYTADGDGSVVEQFIAEKRAAARREAEEIEGTEGQGGAA